MVKKKHINFKDAFLENIYPCIKNKIALPKKLDGPQAFPLQY